MKFPPSQNDADESAAAAPCTDLLLCTQITYSHKVCAENLDLCDFHRKLCAEKSEVCE